MEKEQNTEQLSESKLEYFFDQEVEVELFYEWLFENNFKRHKDLIYHWFPELTDIHLNPDNLSGDELRDKYAPVIEKAILNFREKHSENIQLAENNIKADLPMMSEEIGVLEDIMGETEHSKFQVMPSVYPICPFDPYKNLFYFTITRVAEGQTKFDNLRTIAPHEISHFIFYRQIARIPNSLAGSDLESILSSRVIHHLKEVLTPVILQNPELKQYYGDVVSHGNPESVSYQVEVDGKVMSIYDYVMSEYEKDMSTEGYDHLLHWIINLFEKIGPEVLVRDELYAKNARAIFTDPELKAKFMEPIKINK